MLLSKKAKSEVQCLYMAFLLFLVDPVFAEPGPGGRALTEEQVRANQAKLEDQGKTEMSLTLTSKFEHFEDDDTDMKALFVRTKRMVVDVLRTQSGDNLGAILYTPATEEQVNV